MTHEGGALTAATLADRLDAALPQTQCTRCGFPDCRAYAEAIATTATPINQCPPGGAEGIARLAAITGREMVPLSHAHGREGPRKVMFVDEAWCIGCTLCIKACPVDCIVGAPKVMHTIIEGLCTGCELCLPVCPVDCIAVEDATPGRTGWQAWGDTQANGARTRYAAHKARVQRETAENEARLAAKAQAKLNDLATASALIDPVLLDRKRAAIDAAMQRARTRANKTP